MKKSSLVLSVAGAALATLGMLVPLRMAEAQSGSRGGGESHSKNVSSKRPHYDVLWDWLQRSNYKNWKGANGQAPDFQKGESPHGVLIKTYVDKVASRNIKDLPPGSVIVKENYSPDKKLMAITVMQRSKGYDPEHGDWYYAKYNPDGKIATTPPEMKSMPVAGKFMMCIECHSGADGNDFAFFND